jgi:hypothetical protein
MSTIKEHIDSMLERKQQIARQTGNVRTGDLVRDNIFVNLAVVFCTVHIDELHDALERLTAWDVELPESDWHPAPHERAIKPEDAIDYGNRRAAAAVLAERERCALVSEQAFRFAKDGYEIADLIREGTP